MRNQIINANMIDKSKFLINTSVSFASMLLRATELVLRGDSPNNHVFQCRCGAIFIVAVDSLDKIPRDDNNTLLCSSCGHYTYTIGGRAFFDAANVTAVREEFDSLFDEARRENLLTMALFGRVCQNYFNKELLSIKLSISLFQRQSHLLNIVEYLHRLGIVQIGRDVRYDTTWAYESDQAHIRLKLLQYCHMVELVKVYHALHDLILIARNKVRLVNAQGKSPSILLKHTNILDIMFNPVCPANHIIYDEQCIIPIHQIDNTRLSYSGAGVIEKPPKTYDAVEALKNLCDKYNIGIGEHVRFFYDNQLRNAFSHSQYDIQGTRIYLTYYDRVIDFQRFEAMLERCQCVLSAFLNNLLKATEVSFSPSLRGVENRLKAFSASPLYAVNV